MQTKKAIALNDFLMNAINLVLSTVDEGLLVPELKINDISEFTKENFDKHYAEFDDELKLNILKYKDYDIIYDYITHYLNEFLEWEGFESDFNKKIFKSNIQISELLNIIMLINEQVDNLYILVDSGINNYGNLSNHINRILHPSIKAQEEEKFVIDKRFIFEDLKNEIKDQKLSTLDAIDFLNNRITEFKQWIIVNDSSNHNGHIIHPNSDKHYPKFIELCQLETTNLNNRLKLENEKIKQKALEKNSVVIQASDKSPFKWNSTDTNFLELFAALYQNESIVRADGKPLTRKEMLNYFQEILGMEIKDVEGKLSRAGNRNENTAFLDSLAQQFRNYVAEKEKKQTRRK